MSAETPKSGSPELAGLLERLRRDLGVERCAELLGLIVERPRVERLVARAARGRHPPFKSLGNPQLAALAVNTTLAQDAGAYDLAHELDRGTSGERSLVGSMPAADVEQRVNDGRALRIPRHGAKLVWAILRDERPEVQRLAPRAIELYFVKPTEATPASAAPPMSTRQLEALEAEISQVEKERARLIAEVGKREAALQYESALRKELAARIAELEQKALVTAPQPLEDPQSLRNEVRRLEKRLAHQERELEELAGLRERVAQLEEDNERKQATITSLRAARALEQAPREAPRPADAKVTTLAPAPQLSAAITAALGSPLVSPPRRVKTRLTAAGVRVGMFVDVANISGAARRVFPGRAVDYAELLVQLSGGRTLVEARAYVVDKEGESFDAFHAALRHAGYKVASKKPKIFPDGTVKADWDVGITIDALAAAEKLDVVVLVSGDGDFVPLVSALKRAQLQVEGAAFVERTASELKSAVDHFLELGATVLED